MELDELKNAWHNVKTPDKDAGDIKAMLSESNHPVLKGIRRQVIIEVAAWSIFLVCYYTMFDGDTKPVWINIVLVVSVLFPLIHNLMGYSFARYLVNGDTLKESLTVYLAKVKVYAAVSIASRVLFAAGFVVFFTYGLSLTAARYYSVAIIGLIFLFQLWVLSRIWAKRLNNIKTAVQGFE
ncbi:MAG: hypothetical protein V4553_18660 [Bacteroidota bacterium]